MSKKNPPIQELPQHCSFNHLEIFLLPGNISRDFSPQVLICWQFLLCPRCPKIVCMARCHSRATMIRWSLAHYRVTTVWLHVEAVRTVQGIHTGWRFVSSFAWLQNTKKFLMIACLKMFWYCQDEQRRVWFLMEEQSDHHDLVTILFHTLLVTRSKVKTTCGSAIMEYMKQF